MSAPSRGRVLSTPSGAGCAEGASHARVRLVGAEVRDLAVDQVHVALGAARELRVMGDQQDRGPHLVDLLEQVQHLARHQGIEVAGRLVREQECRVPGDGARDGDALLLPAGELRGHVPGARGEPDQLERAADALAPVGAAQAAVAQRHLHVVIDVEVGDEVEALEDETDALIAQLRTLVVGERPHVPALEQVAAGVKLLEQPRYVEEGGLARSRGPGDRHELPRRHLEREPAQRVRLDEVGTVDLADIVHLEHVVFLRNFPQIQWPMPTSAASWASRMSEITTSSPAARPRIASISVTEAAPSTTGTRTACAPRTTYRARVTSSMNELRSNFRTPSRSSITMRTAVRSFCRRPGGCPPPNFTRPVTWFWRTSGEIAVTVPGTVRPSTVTSACMPGLMSRA